MPNKNEEKSKTKEEVTLVTKSFSTFPNAITGSLVMTARPRLPSFTLVLSKRLGFAINVVTNPKPYSAHTHHQMKICGLVSAQHFS